MDQNIHWHSPPKQTTQIRQPIVEQGGETTLFHPRSSGPVNNRVIRNEENIDTNHAAGPDIVGHHDRILPDEY
jgi:hypothetical protein